MGQLWLQWSRPLLSVYETHEVFSNGERYRKFRVDCLSDTIITGIIIDTVYVYIRITIWR